MQSVRSEDSTPLVVTHVAYVAKKFSSTLTEVEMTLNNISVTILCWRITGLSAENYSIQDLDTNMVPTLSPMLDSMDIQIP